MKVGTIGTGEITNWFLTCWQQAGNDCYAIYSRTKDSGEKLRSAFHGEKVYTNLDLFLADEKIDVVYIASPNSLHFSHAKQALEAGKHVILEKPFTSTLEECEELIILAKQNRLFLMEGITVPDLPNVKALHSLISNIGNIHVIVANMSKVSSKYKAYLRNEHPNVFTTKYSGGALMDLNVYNLHLLTDLFGRPKTIAYFASIKDGIDFSGTCILQYLDKQAVCIASKNSEANNFVEIQGELGCIRINSSAATVSNIELQLINGTKETYQSQIYRLTHIYYIKAFMKMVEEKNFEERDCKLLHTKMVMELLVQARKSAGIRFEADK